jgi:nucleoside-diphosphate-sugar epimerase
LPNIIYTTGITGFIGQHLLKKLINEYDITVNFGRNNKISIYQSSLNPIYKNFNLNELETYQADSIFHLATYYNPNPKDLSEEDLLEESNFNFPFNLCNDLKKLGLKKIISTSSYMQLLDSGHQNLYSETKNKLISWARSEFEVTEIFLFDTFGPNDQRNKVLDVFIRNVISNQDINIPSTKIDINLTHVEEIVNTLIKCPELSAGQYMIMSNNHTTIEELAKSVIALNKTSAKIKTNLDAKNFFENINSFPSNIYQKTLELDFQEQLMEKNNEIREANSI